MTVIVLPDLCEPFAAPSAAPWGQFIEALHEPVWLIEPAGLTLVAANRAAALLLGTSRESLLGRPAAELLATPEDRAFWDDVLSGTVHDLHSHIVLGRPDGSVLHLERRISRLATGEGAPGFLVSLLDHTHERRAGDERQALLDDLRATFESTADGLLVIDAEGRIRAFNRRFAHMWALPVALLEAGDDAAVFDWMRRSVADSAGYQRRLVEIVQGPPQETTDELTLHNGQVFERISLPKGPVGRVSGRVWSFRDLSDRVAAERRIESLVSTDPLTGLPHRAQLVQRMALAGRGGERFALLLIDLDHFKQINDSLGHRIGDAVLVEVSERIHACLREGDVMARIGGDQFALLIHRADGRGAEHAARRVLDACARTHDVEGAQFTLTCSIGVALCPLDGIGPDDLLRHAETAVQRAKEGGRAGYRFHHARRDDAGRARMSLDHAMRRALADGGFRLHYQPQVALDTGRVLGAEALLRWRDAERGDVSPGVFIPVAEDSGFIVAIGDWVLREAVRQAADWRRQGLPLPVSINVSALQFQQADFVERVARALHEAGLPPEQLELELTESLLLRDAEEALARLQALATLGVGLAIDDFGTGYSNLAYLKRFPIRRLKIDRSFVSGLPDDASDAAIVRAILDLARALRLEVIAEGVETEAQRRCLQDAGCKAFQGFLYARALAPAEFLHKVRPRLG